MVGRKSDYGQVKKSLAKLRKEGGKVLVIPVSKNYVGMIDDIVKSKKAKGSAAAVRAALEFAAANIEALPEQKKNLIVVECAFCHNSKEVSPVTAERHRLANKPIYCSRTCAARSRLIR